MNVWKWVSSLFSSRQEQEKEEELVRARDEKGRFVADDPSTIKNEAYVNVSAVLNADQIKKETQ